MPGQLIFENKSVDGFWLGPFIASKNLLQIMLMWRRAQKPRRDGVEERHSGRVLP